MDLYEIKAMPGLYGLDVVSPKEAVIDQIKMTMSGILASSTRDREGDILDIAGVDTANHRFNPVVLLGHGLEGWSLPVGKTEDENGNYTVELDPTLGEIRDTIYFSQHSKMSEQIFYLCAEKILRAQSIGLRVFDKSPLGAGKRGNLIKRCEMTEASVCAIPQNPECLADVVGKGMIGSQPMEIVLKSLFQPYIPVRKVMVSVPSVPAEVKSMSEEMSSVDATRGGALVKDDMGEDEGMSADQVEPLGKSILKAMHEKLSGMMDECVKAVPACENGKVLKLCEKCIKSWGEHVEAIKSLHDSEYGDGAEDDGEPDEPEQVEPAEDRERDKAGKSYGMNYTSASGLKFEDGRLVGVVEPEEAVSEEEVTKLERAIARREKMLGLR